MSPSPGEVHKRHVKGKPGLEPEAIEATAVATAAEHGIGRRTDERDHRRGRRHGAEA